MTGTKWGSLVKHSRILWYISWKPRKNDLVKILYGCIMITWFGQDRIELVIGYTQIQQSLIINKKICLCISLFCSQTCSYFVPKHVFILHPNLSLFRSQLCLHFVPESCLYFERNSLPEIDAYVRWDAWAFVGVASGMGTLRRVRIVPPARCSRPRSPRRQCAWPRQPEIKKIFFGFFFLDRHFIRGQIYSSLNSR